MVIVAEYLVDGTIVEHRKRGAPVPNRGKLLAQRHGARAAGFAGEPFSQRDNHRFGQRLPGPRSQLSCEAIGFRVLDAQGHVKIIDKEDESITVAAAI